MAALEQMDPAVFYDHTLRFTVPSRSDPHAVYVVQLDSYSGNGECTCMDFETRKRPLLARRVTPEQAYQQKQAKIGPTGRISDCLRCGHIIDARDQLATAVIKTIAHVEKIHRNPPQQ